LVFGVRTHDSLWASSCARNLALLPQLNVEAGAEGEQAEHVEEGVAGQLLGYTAAWELAVSSARGCIRRVEGVIGSGHGIEWF
jgi:hypothetical protein